MPPTVISWRTHKRQSDYRWVVFSLGHQIATEILKEGVCATRARAAGMGRRWVRYLTVRQRRAE